MVVTLNSPLGSFSLNTSTIAARTVPDIAPDISPLTPACSGRGVESELAVAWSTVLTLDVVVAAVVKSVVFVAILDWPVVDDVIEDTLILPSKSDKVSNFAASKVFKDVASKATLVAIPFNDLLVKSNLTFGIRVSFLV